MVIFHWKMSPWHVRRAATADSGSDRWWLHMRCCERPLLLQSKYSIYQKISSAMEIVLAECFQPIPSHCCWHSKLTPILGDFTRVSWKLTTLIPHSVGTLLRPLWPLKCNVCRDEGCQFYSQREVILDHSILMICFFSSQWQSYFPAQCNSGN